MLKVKTQPLFFLALLIGLVFVSILLYFRGLHGPFLVDDFGAVFSLKDADFSAQGLREVYKNTTSGIHPLSRIIPSLSFVANFQWMGDESVYFKSTNLVIHALIASVIVALGTKLYQSNQYYGEKTAQQAALFVGLIWLVHPMFVSTTLYTVQRIAQLSTLFTLLALYIFACARMNGDPRRKWLLYFGFYPLIVALGLLSKENTILVIPLSFVLSVYLNNCPNTSKKDSVDRFFEKLFILFPLLVGIAAFLFLHERFLNYSQRDFTLFERVLTQIHFLAFYIKQLLLPRLSDLSLVLDGHPYVTQWSVSTIALAAGQVAVILTATAMLFRGSLFGLAILFFYAGHALESTILPLEMGFEHRNYLPSFGIFLLLVHLVQRFLGVQKGALVLTLIAFGFSSLTWVRVGFWKSEYEWIKTNYTFQERSVRARLSYLMYLQVNQNRSEHDRVNEQGIIDFPMEVGFRINKLNVECAEADKTGVYAELIDELVSVISNQRINNIDVSQINTLVTNYTKVACNNISLDRIQEVVDAAIVQARKQNSDLLLGHLVGTESMIASRQGNYQQSHDLLIQAFELTGEAEYVFNSVVVFLFDQNLEKAQATLDDIRDGVYFDPRYWPEAIRLLESDVRRLERKKKTEAMEAE